MRKQYLICKVIMVVSFFMMLGSIASAQDFVKVNPKYTKVLTDTLGVRMIKVTLAPGEELAMHSHPSEMLYCIKSGQLTVTYKSGRKEVDDIKAGDAYQGPPQEAHSGKNTGKTTFVFLEIEIKDRKK